MLTFYIEAALLVLQAIINAIALRPVPELLWVLCIGRSAGWQQTHIELEALVWDAVICFVILLLFSSLLTRPRLARDGRDATHEVNYVQDEEGQECCTGAEAVDLHFYQVLIEFIAVINLACMYNFWTKLDNESDRHSHRNQEADEGEDIVALKVDFVCAIHFFKEATPHEAVLGQFDNKEPTDNQLEKQRVDSHQFLYPLFLIILQF